MEEREQEKGSSSQNVNISISLFRERGTYIEIILSDSSSFFILHDDVSDLNHYPGDFANEETVARLAAFDRICRACNKALDLLSFSPSTAFMMKQKLMQKGFDSISAGTAVSRLLEKHILDDKKYAENWVASRLSRNPESPLVLKASLLKKGVDRKTADEILKGITPDSDQYIEAFEKAFNKQLRSPGKSAEKIRISLSRKGFPLSLINKYLDNKT